MGETTWPLPGHCWMKFPGSQLRLNLSIQKVSETSLSAVQFLNGVDSSKHVWPVAQGSMCSKIAMNSAQHICDNRLAMSKGWKIGTAVRGSSGKRMKLSLWRKRDLIEEHSNRARRAVYRVFSELDTKHLMHLNVIFYRKLWKLLTVKQEEDGTLCFK